MCCKMCKLMCVNPLFILQFCKIKNEQQNFFAKIKKQLLYTKCVNVLQNVQMCKLNPPSVLMSLCLDLLLK